MVKTIMLDFGGVLAEEGFREGLKEIARKNGLYPDAFFSAADALIYETGYLTGTSAESVFWSMLRDRTGIQGPDQELREEILQRFVLRPDMMACVDSLRSKGYMVVMLSDQTNWLDEIDQQKSLFRHFDRVLNSFRTHKSKRDERTFSEACALLAVKPEETVFVDDNPGHIERASNAGLKTIHFRTFDEFNKQLLSLTEQSCMS